MISAKRASLSRDNHNNRESGTRMSSTRPVTAVKLVLLGEAAVGKSSLVLRFVSDDFQENKGKKYDCDHDYDSCKVQANKTQEPTIGAAFLTQRCAIGDKTIKFEIWDTAGQERFASLAPMYYRNAQAALVVYDITKPASFIKARHWVKELHEQAAKDIIIALVGNKYDLVEENEEENRKVAYDEGKQLAEEEGLLFFETSAKTAFNVKEVFLAIGNKIPDAGNSSATSEPRADSSRVDLNVKNDSAPGGGCNC